MRQDVFSILYLEDEEKDREAMRALIESMETEAKKEGYIRLTMVSGSEDLFQVSSQTQYDLLILDMNLQGIVCRPKIAYLSYFVFYNSR